METTNSETMVTQPVGMNSKEKDRNMLILLAVLLLVIFAIFITAFVLAARSTQPAVVIENTSVVSEPVSTPVTSDTGLTPEEQMNEGNPSTTTNGFSGRLYNLTFDYSKDLGTASSKTSKFSYGTGLDCSTETISFSNQPNVNVGISSGHCEGGSGGDTNTTKVVSKDGKSFFMGLTEKADYTELIYARGGIDSSDTEPHGVVGVFLTADNVSNTGQAQGYIRQMIESMRVELSPLKSQDFDIVH